MPHPNYLIFPWCSQLMLDMRCVSTDPLQSPDAHGDGTAAGGHRKEYSGGDSSLDSICEVKKNRVAHKNRAAPSVKLSFDEQQAPTQSDLDVMFWRGLSPSLPSSTPCPAPKRLWSPLAHHGQSCSREAAASAVKCFPLLLRDFFFQTNLSEDFH